VNLTIQNRDNAVLALDAARDDIVRRYFVEQSEDATLPDFGFTNRVHLVNELLIFEVLLLEATGHRTFYFFIDASGELNSTDDLDEL
jgi:hypothetical protein